MSFIDWMAEEFVHVATFYYWSIRVFNVLDIVKSLLVWTLQMRVSPFFVTTEWLVTIEQPMYNITKVSTNDEITSAKHELYFSKIVTVELKFQKNYRYSSLPRNYISKENIMRMITTLTADRQWLVSKEVWFVVMIIHVCTKAKIQHCILSLY